MKKLFVLLILFLIPKVSAQSKVNFENLVVYGKKYFKQDEDKPFNGKTFMLSPKTGKKIMEAIMRNGLFRGSLILNYPDGKKMFEANMLDNRFYGRVRGWYANG